MGGKAFGEAFVIVGFISKYFWINEYIYWRRGLLIFETWNSNVYADGETSTNGMLTFCV